MRELALALWMILCLAWTVSAQVTITSDAPEIQTVAVGPDPTTRTLVWTPGRCTSLFRVWVFRQNAWRFFDETTDLTMVVPVMKKPERWRVSAVCDDPEGITEWVIKGGEVTVNPGPWEVEVP